MTSKPRIGSEKRTTSFLRTKGLHVDLEFLERLDFFENAPEPLTRSHDEPYLGFQQKVRPRSCAAGYASGTRYSQHVQEPRANARRLIFQFRSRHVPSAAGR